MAVFRPIQPSVDCPTPPASVRDLFLHALFARIALNDNTTIEFRTVYDPATDTIDLDIPDCNVGILDTVTGMQQGPRFRAFIAWLVGGAGGGGSSSSGLIDADISTNGVSASTAEQILNQVTIPGSTLSTDIGIKVKAWGTFAAGNKYLKTVKLKFGNTTVATNDIVTRPDGQTWTLSAVIFQKASGQEAIGEGFLGAVAQTQQATQPDEDETSDIVVRLTGKSSSPIADNVVCRGLYVEFA